MSSFMVSNESICMLSDFLSHVVNSRSKEVEYGFDDQLVSDLQKCFIVWNKPVNGYVEESAIHEELYNMNYTALDERYPDKVNVNYENYKPSHLSFYPEWNCDKQRYNVTQLHYQTLKSLQCYLYQCCEGDIPDTYDLYKLLKKVINRLSMWIIENTQQYNDAEWK